MPRSSQTTRKIHNMEVTQTTRLEHDVVQREFSIAVAGEAVPCVTWEPDSNVQPRGLIAMGHGGSQHKKTRDIRNRAIRYARNFGWASLALDAPKHGGRVSREEAEEERLKTQARVTGDTNAPSMNPQEKIRFLDTLAAQAVPEWQAALDTVLEHLIPGVASMGYWGVSQGTWIGVPLLAVERRFRCAVLGLSQLHPDHVAFRSAAQRITIPHRFAFQWDDPIRTREYGIELFNAFRSTDKSMHINPGGHREIPATEAESWDDFFQQHLD